jgi:hypothetical protein
MYSVFLVIFCDLLAAWSDGNVWVNMLEQAGQHGARSAPIGQIIFYFFLVKKTNKKWKCKQMSLLTIWPLFLLVSKPNICQVPSYSFLFCFCFYSSSAQALINDKFFKMANCRTSFGMKMCLTQTQLSFECKGQNLPTSCDLANIWFGK